MFMFDYDHGNLPEAFSSFFSKINDIHTYKTRSASLGKLAYTVKPNTVKHGDSLLKNLGLITK